MSEMSKQTLPKRRVIVSDDEETIGTRLRSFSTKQALRLVLCLAENR
jgi:hypothetical protein